MFLRLGVTSPSVLIGDVLRYTVMQAWKYMMYLEERLTIYASPCMCTFCPVYSIMYL
jgi:hypothetical protein